MLTKKKDPHRFTSAENISTTTFDDCPRGFNSARYYIDLASSFHTTMKDGYRSAAETSLGFESSH